MRTLKACSPAAGPRLVSGHIVNPARVRGAPRTRGSSGTDGPSRSSVLTPSARARPAKWSTARRRLPDSRRERVERSMLAARQPAGASSPARYPVPAAVAGRADRATPRRRLPPWQTRLPQPVASGRRRRGRPVGDRAGADRYDGCCWRPGWTTATPRSPASSRCGAVGVPLPVLPRLGSPRPDPRGSRPWPAWRPPRLAAAAAAAHLKRRRHPAHQRTRRSRHRRP